MRYLGAGARLVQVYRAYVERGGELIGRINRELAAFRAAAAGSATGL